MLNPPCENLAVANSLNLQDDDPSILFGPHVDEPSREDSPPFYISLKIHDTILHNAMLNSGASHSLMPKLIMEKLGLEVTRPYKDPFSFDSNKVKSLGLIKDLAVSLAQIPSKILVMDVVVADIPLKFEMLLSRSWASGRASSKVRSKWICRMPPSLSSGRQRRLYREQKMAYMVSNAERPNNHPIYSLDTEMV